MIFTLPHALHDLWRYNRAWFTQVLFEGVAKTLQAFCSDPDYLGAVAGFTLALHPWGRSLSLHPHLHVLITDGGLNVEGQWQRPQRSVYLPMRAVMTLFRGKLLARIVEAVIEGTLELPPNLTAQQCRNLCNRLGREKWNVHLCQRYTHGDGVMTYLARYLRGGPLNNTQLVEADEDTVTFRYRSHPDAEAESGMQTLSLSPTAFLARYLQHAPLPHRPVVRHYGLYATRNADLLDRARTVLGQLPVVDEPPTKTTAVAIYVARAGRATPATHCVHCGQALVMRRPLPRQQSPCPWAVLLRSSFLN